MRLDKNEKSVLSDIFSSYEQLIYKTVYRILGSKEDAEDITIDTCVKLLPYFLDEKREVNIGFIYVTARNIALNKVKRRKIESRLLDEHFSRINYYKNFKDEFENKVDYAELREKMLLVSAPTGSPSAGRKANWKRSILPCS